ncbi:enoyl-CoA hydratase/isomerase family protein [Gemmatimonas aurantiaca]|nr:enoyl-CoA hydratase/isomerase family protein [Gemmatimonas aurantiaca]
MTEQSLPNIETLLIEKSGAIARVILNRPAKRNSLDRELIAGLTRAFHALAEDDSVSVIILSGAGGHFCSGLYLNYLQEINKFGHEENLKDSERFLNLLLAIYRCRKPVIAQVAGYALAGGCGIASACDLVIAADTATFGYTEVRFGFVPALVSAFLIKRVGESHAKDLLLTARFVDATEAQTMGLVNKVVAADMLETTTNEYAALLEKNTASSLAHTKDMFEKIGDLPLQSALNYARDLNAEVRQTEDFKKGLAGILKRL